MILSEFFYWQVSPVIYVYINGVIKKNERIVWNSK